MFGFGTALGTALGLAAGYFGGEQYRKYKDEVYNSFIIEPLQNQLAASCLTDKESTIPYEDTIETDLPIAIPVGSNWREYYTFLMNFNLYHARKIHPDRKFDLDVQFKYGEFMAYDELHVNATFKSSKKDSLQ